MLQNHNKSSGIRQSRLNETVSLYDHSTRIWKLQSNESTADIY